MVDQRSINALRDSAAQMEVGSDDDSSPIHAMFPIAGAMHIIKANGIYRIQLADEIDPQRTNPSILNTQQRVLAFGSDCDLVRQTLLTSKRLFDSKLLGPSFSYDRAIELTFEALKDIIAMHEMRMALDADLKRIEASLASLAPKNRGLSVPSLGDARIRVETILQKADHAVADLFEIAKLFYPDQIGRRWFESLLVFIKDKHGNDAPFTDFLTKVLPLLQLVRNARNCVEHPKANERLDVFDVTLLPNNHLRPPSLEIIHPETPHPLMAINSFMAQLIEQIADIFELMLSFLCGYNVQPFAGLHVQVVRYPPDLQKAFGVRYGYGIYNGDQVVPFG
jgi:hypothetical protein